MKPEANTTEGIAQLRQRLQLAQKQTQEIGRMPPRPAGLRAALGAMAVSVMQRLMFWYAPGVRLSIGTVTDVVDDALRDLDSMIRQDSGRIGVLEARLQEVYAELAHRLMVGIKETRSAFERQLQEGIRQERSYAAMLEARIGEHSRLLELERSTTIGIQGDVREQTEALQQLAEERRQKEAELETRLLEAGERLQLLRRETLDNAQRLARLLDEARRTEPAAAAPSEGTPEPAGMDGLRAAIEVEVRGTRGEAQERWRRTYLPLMPHDGPVLDLGCGRGEWLELLREAGVAARGIDSNRLLVAECRDRFLDAEHGEALEYLARIPDASVGAVTALRLVEQLPFEQLVRLLDEVTRVLRPGGTAIFETPNPDNLLVASRDFYNDPERLRPMPSATLRAVLEARGLDTVEVRPVNPADPEDRLPEEEGGTVARRLNRMFYGPRDYAVVSRKPSL